MPLRDYLSAVQRIRRELFFLPGGRFRSGSVGASLGFGCGGGSSVFLPLGEGGVAGGLGFRGRVRFILRGFFFRGERVVFGFLFRSGSGSDFANLFFLRGSNHLVDVHVRRRRDSETFHGVADGRDKRQRSLCVHRPRTFGRLEAVTAQLHDRSAVGVHYIIRRTAVREFLRGDPEKVIPIGREGRIRDP